MRHILPHNAKLVPKNAKRVFKGIIYDVYHWDQEMFDGSTATFEMLKRPDTVKALAIKDDKIQLIEQEQPGHEAFYDLPGGRHDNESETELEAVKRELLEETGMRFKTWRLLEVTQPFTKIEGFVYIFLATDFESQIEPNTDAGEKIILTPMTVAQVKNLVNDPRCRYLPKDILRSVESLDELLSLPTFEGQTVD